MSHGPAVWITGIGTANPLGMNYEETARNLLAGMSGVRPVDRFDTSHLSSTFAGQIGDLPCPAGFEPGEFSRIERMEQLVVWCASEALRNAGLWNQRSNLRLGVVLGNGGEWLRLWEAD